MVEQIYQDIVSRCEAMRPMPTGELKRAMMRQVIDEIKTQFEGRTTRGILIDVAIDAFLDEVSR